MNHKDTETQRQLKQAGQYLQAKSIFIRLFRCEILLKISVSLCLCSLIFVANLKAQELPDEIRGYKVYKAKISVSNKTDNPDNTGKIDKESKKDEAEAFVRVTEPQLINTSLTGLTFELSAEIDALEYSGKIDFLTFKDFKVNGLNVDIEEYKDSFEIKKNQIITLPRPIRIYLGSGQALKGVFGEVTGSKEEWLVTGRVFVFGRFKKLGFNFKRVVPVDVNVKIKNPVKKEKILPGIGIPDIPDIISDIIPSF